MSTVNGRYVIERRLGGGGMAEVFLARTIGAEGFSRQVAIKRVLPGYSERPEFASMFITEAQLTSRLQHPNIVSILDFDRDREDGGRLFLVLELVEGTDLDGLLATGPLPFSLVIYLAIEILRGLDYAHALPITNDGLRGIVHRDISPHNVLLSWEGAVKVSDFGIAKAHAASNASASILIKGKPAYMSPEQANGQPLDGRSDLFAVGVMLFEMLTLRPLFAGSTTQETLARLLFSPIPDMRQVRPEVPEDLARIVAGLLERDRQLRTPNGAAAIAALQACADYPRAGREDLVAMLSQRFMGRAPSRSRGSIRSLPPNAATIAAPPAIAAPSHPQMATSAGPPTRTMPQTPEPARRRRLWPLLVVFLAASGVVGVVVASTRSAKSIATVPAAADDTTAPAAANPNVPIAPPRTPSEVRPASAAPVLGAESGASAATEDRAKPVTGVSPDSATEGSAKSAAGKASTPGATPKRDREPPAHRTPPTKQKSDGIQEIHL